MPRRRPQFDSHQRVPREENPRTRTRARHTHHTGVQLWARQMSSIPGTCTTARVLLKPASAPCCINDFSGPCSCSCMTRSHHCTYLQSHLAYSRSGLIALCSVYSRRDVPLASHESPRMPARESPTLSGTYITLAGSHFSTSKLENKPDIPSTSRDGRQRRPAPYNHCRTSDHIA